VIAATLVWPAAALAARSLPVAVAEAVPAARLVGQGHLAWWGFAAYDASLWAPPGLTRRAFASHPFVLELAYLRAFKSDDIARVSHQEMLRAEGPSREDAQRWRTQLRALVPDVGPGDRLAGVHAPGRGARFYFNDRFSGEIPDAMFSLSFFGIWLGPATSQPALRAALFGATPP
jgi:hypothetical protein